MKRDLPKHMYQTAPGRAYYLARGDGPKVNLGRDRIQALRQYHVLMSPESTIDQSAAAEVMWKRHTKGARQRKLEFSISLDEVRALLVAQGFRCAVTRLPFREDKPAGMRIKPWAPSIDRMDGTKGYVPGNVRIVCSFVNVAMNGFGEHFFSMVLEPLIEAGVQARLAGAISHGIPGLPTASAC